jgi:hypothetical protein
VDASKAEEDDIGVDAHEHHDESAGPSAHHTHEGRTVSTAAEEDEGGEGEGGGYTDVLAEQLAAKLALKRASKEPEPAASSTDDDEARGELPGAAAAATAKDAADGCGSLDDGTASESTVTTSASTCLPAVSSSSVSEELPEGAVLLQDFQTNIADIIAGQKKKNSKQKCEMV